MPGRRKEREVDGKKYKHNLPISYRPYRLPGQIYFIVKHTRVIKNNERIHSTSNYNIYV